MSPRRLKLLGLAVSVLSVAAVVWWAAHQSAPRLPRSAADLTRVGIAVVVYFVTAALRAERWRELLAFNGVRASRADCYGLTAVGYMGNNVLPARGGDVLRTVLIGPRSRGGDARTVVGTLVAERIADVFVLVTLFVVVAFGLLHGVALPSGGRFLLAAAALVVLALLGALAAWVLHRRGLLARAWAFAKPLVGATANLRGRHGAQILALTMATWALEVTCYWLVADAAALDVSLLESGYLLSLASIFVLIPSGPGYAGTFDAAMVFGARALGRTASQALAYVLLLRFVIFLPITLVGLIVLVARYGGLRRGSERVRRDPRAAPPPAR